jgi:hypothetical protein
MALMLRTIGQVRTAFKRWADRFVKDNGLGDAVRAHDLEKVRRIANAKLSKVEAGVLVEYYFPDLVRERVKRELLWPSASNAGRKRRQRERNQDKIVGDRLNPKPARVTRSSTLQKLSQHIKFRNNLLENAEPDISEDFKVKEIVSLSSDVIFNPATQTTRYSAQREAKRNLERRMQGYEIDVLYGSLIRRQIYGIYHETRQLLQCPLHLSGRARQELRQMGELSHQRGGGETPEADRA